MSSHLSTLSDEFVLRFARDLYHCSSCNYCVDALWPERGLGPVCATMEQHTRAPGYSGRGFIESARAVIEGTALDGAGLAARVFTCTTCGNCESACPIGLRPASIGHALRQELYAADQVPPPIRALQHSVATQANPYGLPADQRMTWAPELSAPSAVSAPIYFAGCAAAFAYPEEARAGYELMHSAGVTPMVVATGCCGAPLAETGAADLAAVHARACAERLADEGRGVIVAGYACLRQLAVDAKHVSMSLAAWLCAAVRADAIKLVRKPEVRDALHVHLLETCQLKRRTANAPATDEDAVRALFESLEITLTNPHFPSAHAICCGAAGGMPAMQPAAATRMALARVPVHGIVVSLDPRCAAHLRSAANDLVTPKIYGLAEFITTYFVIAPSSPSAL